MSGGGQVRGPRRRKAPGSLRGVSRALARRHLRGSGSPEEHRQGGGPGEGPVLRALGPGPVHETGGGGRGLDPNVPS